MSTIKLPDFKELRVLLRLLDGEDALKERNLVFKSSGGSMSIGRASKTERKQLASAEDDLWISNPVISRNHAKLILEKDEYNTPSVYLEDTESSHGTFVNNIDIKGNGRRRVYQNDTIQLGSKIIRGQDEFQPPVFNLSYKPVYLDPVLTRQSSPGRSISVPDDYSDEDEEDMDMDMEESSDNESTDSHSSPPHLMEAKNPQPVGTSDNPFVLDHDSPRPQVVIDLAAEMPEDELEDVEAADGIIQDTFAEDTDDVEDEEEHEARPYPAMATHASDGDDEEEYAPQEADIFVTNNRATPSWIMQPVEECPAPTTMVPQHMQYVPFNMSDYPVMTHQYADGPFSQTAFFNNGMDDVSEASHAATAGAALLQGRQHEEIFPSSLTVTTQEILEANRSKADMSIRNLINPTNSVIGSKRKADQIESEHDADDEEDQADTTLLSDDEEYDSQALFDDEADDVGPVSFTTLADEESGVTRVYPRGKDCPGFQLHQAELKARANRPLKRLRRAATHVGAFALGGMTVLGGLMALPDGYFGN